MKKLTKARNTPEMIILMKESYQNIDNIILICKDCKDRLGGFDQDMPVKLPISALKKEISVITQSIPKIKDFLEVISR